nr:hypothetical protein [Deltaproteobacteria bacterium]
MLPTPSLAPLKSPGWRDTGPTVGSASLGPRGGGGCEESAAGVPLARRRGITFSTNCSSVMASGCCSARWRKALSASATSLAVAYRCSAFGLIARRTTARSASGASGTSTSGSGSRPSLTRVRRVCASGTSANHGRPSSSSSSTTPRAKTSARRSTGSPRACSGAM